MAGGTSKGVPWVGDRAPLIVGDPPSRLGAARCKRRPALTDRGGCRRVCTIRGVRPGGLPSIQAEQKMGATSS